MGFIKKGILGQPLKHFLFWLEKSGIIANSYRILHGRKTSPINFSYYFIYIFFFYSYFHIWQWERMDEMRLKCILENLKGELKWISLSLLFWQLTKTSTFNKFIYKSDLKDDAQNIDFMTFTKEELE